MLINFVCLRICLLAVFAYLFVAYYPYFLLIARSYDINKHLFNMHAVSSLRSAHILRKLSSAKDVEMKMLDRLATVFANVGCDSITVF